MMNSDFDLPAFLLGKLYDNISRSTTRRALL